MRKYLLGTGIIGAITSGYTLLKGSDEQPFTWRTALAWLSWAIVLVLAIGEIVDIRRASHGRPHLIDPDSPIAEKADKYARKQS